MFGISKRPFFRTIRCRLQQQSKLVCGSERGMMSMSNRQSEGERRALIQFMTADCRGGALSWMTSAGGCSRDLWQHRVRASLPEPTRVSLRTTTPDPTVMMVTGPEDAREDGKGRKREEKVGLTSGSAHMRCREEAW